MYRCASYQRHSSNDFGNFLFVFGDAVSEALKIGKPYSEESQEHLLLHCQADKDNKLNEKSVPK